MSVPEPSVAEPKPAAKAESHAEKEKTKISKQEPYHEVISEPEIAPTEPAAAPEPVLAPMPEPIPASEITPAPESTPEPTPTAIDSQPGDMVYVPGFGWIESQGPNHVEYAEDMYENGNKIGIMGLTLTPPTHAKSGRLKPTALEIYSSYSIARYMSRRSLIYPASSFSMADRLCFTW